MPRERNPPIPSARAKKRKRSDKVSMDSTKVARIAKQVVLRNQETKHLVYENLSSSITTLPTTWNVMYHGAVRGTTENTFVGESFYLKGIAAKFNGNNNNGVGSSAPYKQTITVYTMIIEAKDFSTIASLTSSQFCDISFSNVAERHWIDPNKARVLAKAKYQIKPGFVDGANGQLEIWSTEMYAPVEKKVRFRNFGTSSELSDWNYYVVAWGDSNITGSGMNLGVNFKAYIKDA